MVNWRKGNEMGCLTKWKRGVPTNTDEYDGIRRDTNEYEGMNPLAKPDDPPGLTNENEGLHSDLWSIVYPSLRKAALRA